MELPLYRWMVYFMENPYQQCYIQWYYSYGSSGQNLIVNTKNRLKSVVPWILNFDPFTIFRHWSSMMFVQLYMNMQNMWILYHLNMYKWELGKIPVDIFVIFYTYIYMHDSTCTYSCILVHRMLHELGTVWFFMAMYQFGDCNWSKSLFAHEILSNNDWYGRISYGMTPRTWKLKSIHQ